MIKLVKMARVWLAVILMLAGLGILPCHATVSGDIAAGLSLEKVIANGLAAGLDIDTILIQTLDSGVELCPLIKAALRQGVDMTRLFSLLRDYCLDISAKYPKDDPRCLACTSCNMMKCAVEAGRDRMEVANAMMAAGESLDQVRGCLGVYTYSPPGMPPGVGPTFPGSGGVASPAS